MRSSAEAGSRYHTGMSEHEASYQMLKREVEADEFDEEAFVKKEIARKSNQ